jgi:hypothetical protein
MSLPFAALEVRSPLMGTVTAVDTVFQRAAAEKLRLTADGPEMRGATPLMGWNETDATANNRVWWMYAAADQFRFDVIDDAKVVGARVFTVDRTLNVVDSFQLFAVTVTQQVGSAWQLYNVGALGDATFERAAIFWAANIFTIQPQQAGAGVARTSKFLTGDGSGITCNNNGVLSVEGSAGGYTTFSVGTDTIALAIANKTTVSLNAGLLFSNNTFGSSYSAAAGTQTHGRFLADVHQSGTAAFVGLDSNVIPTSVGTGSVFGLQVQRSGVPVFQIDVKATLTVDADTVMFLTYFSGAAVKHARVTLSADGTAPAAGFRGLVVAT